MLELHGGLDFEMVNIKTISFFVVALEVRFFENNYDLYCVSARVTIYLIHFATKSSVP